MAAALLAAPVPHRVHMHRRHLKGQRAQHHLIGKACDLHKMPWQHRQQIGIGHHASGREELVDRQHDEAFPAQRGQRLVDKAVRPA